MVWCWKPCCLLCPVPLAQRRVGAESPAPHTSRPPSSPSPLAWKEQGRHHRRLVDAHSPCTVGLAAPAILGATAGPGEAQVSPRCRSCRQRDVPQPVPGCSKPSLFGCCLNRYQGFPTREWCRAMVPWLARESGGLGCRRSLRCTVGRCGQQEGQLGRENGGNPPSEEKTCRQVTSRQEEGRGCPAAGGGGAGGGRVGAWWDQRGCWGGRAASRGVGASVLVLPCHRRAGRLLQATQSSSSREASGEATE